MSPEEWRDPRGLLTKQVAPALALRALAYGGPDLESAGNRAYGIGSLYRVVGILNYSESITTPAPARNRLERGFASDPVTSPRCKAGIRHPLES